MILIVKRPSFPAGGWGYLGEEAGDEWEPLASAQSGEGGVAASFTLATKSAGAESPKAPTFAELGTADGGR